LVPKRKLILGGIEIPHHYGLLGHSDADVLTHAVMDALLGAAALGDIGRHFPDHDTQYAGVSSMILLGDVMELLRRDDWLVINIDATVIAERPKLTNYIPEIRQSFSKHIGIPISHINIKATTEEGLGFSGREEGIAAHAVVLLEKMQA
jgi:2-C-methyl-D-erythritol 2,4-cyclodiphosphate synthase